MNKKLTQLTAKNIFSKFISSKLGVNSFEGKTRLGINPEYISSINKFGVKLFKRLASNGVKENIFISPASIFFALIMANEGAAGDTKVAIQNVLQLDGFSNKEINISGYKLIKSLMRRDSSVELNIANSIWFNKKIKLKHKYVNNCKRYYYSKNFVRDFSGSTIKEINDWVKRKTKGKISEIINQLDPTSILVILNAIYFYGKWSSPFDIKRTQEKTFFLPGGIEKKYPRMCDGGTYKYFENSEYQAVRIPYENRFSMNIILPRERDGLPKFLSTLTDESLSNLILQLRSEEGYIELPRFKIGYFVSLVNILKDLGMEIAFEKNANFNLITEASVWIGEILHKTYLDVNEKGTEAAAVTAISDCDLAGPPPPRPFKIIIDHPFFCIINDNVTGLILFSGAILDPKVDK